jgi:hypothetical protein
MTEFDSNNGVKFDKPYDDNWIEKLTKPEVRVLDYLLKLSKKQKTKQLTLSLSVIVHRLGYTRQLIHVGLCKLRDRGVVEVQASRQGLIIDLSRVFDSGFSLKDIDRSIRKTRIPHQKISVDSVGSEKKTSVSPNPIPANVPISSEHTLQTEQLTPQPVKSAGLVNLVDNLKGCAERIKDEEILSFIKNFDFSEDYDKIYEKALELRRLLKGGKK